METKLHRKPRISYEQAIERCHDVHGDTYTYKKPFLYLGVEQKIEITCNVCGKSFKQSLRSHYNGNGCPYCVPFKIREQKLGIPRNDLKKLLYGVAYCDSIYSIRNEKCYRVWTRMLQRCYDEKFHKKEPTYIGCTVCDEWLLYSNFEKWFNEHYIEGFEIDKDLLCYGVKKIYSPSTCIFLPREINVLLSSKTTKNGKSLPLGVYKLDNLYMAKFGKQYLGLFNTIQDAKNAHNTTKENKIKELANKWKDKIEKRAYDSLINLDVDKFFNNK